MVGIVIEHDVVAVPVPVTAITGKDHAGREKISIAGNKPITLFMAMSSVPTAGSIRFDGVFSLRWLVL
jgi:hypothetical protein